MYLGYFLFLLMTVLLLLPTLVELKTFMLDQDKDFDTPTISTMLSMTRHTAAVNITAEDA